jgi:hypothetical protein
MNQFAATQNLRDLAIEQMTEDSDFLLEVPESAFESCLMALDSDGVNYNIVITQEEEADPVVLWVEGVAQEMDGPEFLSPIPEGYLMPTSGGVMKCELSKVQVEGRMNYNFVA